MDIQSVITRAVAVAGGRFAPGHLGELTRLIPFEMVDAALAETGRVQSRTRDLPSRVVVYLLLAGCLFPELGYRLVWSRLVAGLDGVPVAAPTAGALCQARRRVGAAPLRWLFELLRGPVAGIATPGARWRGLLVYAVDGTTMTVADSPANLTVYRKHRCHNGGSGYPLLRLTALVACGTRTIVDAVFGPTTVGETTQARALARGLRAGTLLLADRNFAAADLLTDLAATGAAILVRCRGDRRLPVLRGLPDGSWLSMLGRLPVRVIDARITLATAADRRVESYRLVTTLLDPHRHPAVELAALYHQRWEIETAYRELKSTILHGRVLRARTPTGIDQEVHALLIVHQLLRTAMADATDTRPDLDPDRASLTIALHTARDLVVQAAGIVTGTTVDLVGTIGRRVLADLLPERRLRTRPRVVKRAISKYNARGTVDRTTYKATITIDIDTPEQPRQPAPTPN